MYTEKQNTLQPGCDDAATGVYMRRAAVVVIAVAYIFVAFDKVLKSTQIRLENLLPGVHNLFTI